LHIPDLPQHSPDLLGSNRTPLPGLEGEGHVTLEKLPDISKEGLHIPELPQHSPELGGSNRTPLPGGEGDNHTCESDLSGRNHTPLPGLEGEGHVTLEKLPDIS
ncbi:hypothetical protein ACTGV6_10650, partial [Streptococcus suis]